MSEKSLEQIIEDDIRQEEDLQIELTPEQLQELIGDNDIPINISELLETEMVNSRTLYLNEEITLDTVNYIIQLIHKFNRDDYEIPVEERSPIILYIDSVGGDLYRTMSLVSTIRASKTPIITIGHGMIASAGLVLYLAGHYKYLSRYITAMYHELRAESGLETLREMQNKVAHFSHLQNTLDNFIVERTKVPMKKLKEKRRLNLDWYLTLDELTRYGFYDALID